MLSNHIGPGQRFASLADHSAFDDSLNLHCWETSRIVKEFVGDWYSKSIYEGTLTPETANRFAHYAFKKIRTELRRRSGGDG